MVIFAQSSYRFTDPIRYFKANDPIYYEVDNIPLKQLQQNDLWLKDQLEKMNPSQHGVGRDKLTELQPYIDGSDNVVYVRPGRYTARINDVFNLQPMQLLNVIPTYEDIVTEKTNNHAYIQQIIDKVKGVVAEDSLALNGLVERIFTKASAWHHTVSPLMLSGGAGYNEARLEALDFGGKWPYPMYKGRLYIRNGVFSPLYDASTVRGLKFDFLPGQSASGNELGYASLPVLESGFIKKWRGVARTSIVDIPEELSIEIPPFNPQDHFYFDSSGQKTLIQEANQRIDLLFVYSKPIDTSAATIAKFVNGGNTPTKIYTPQLGIVKGAGLGLNKRSSRDLSLSHLDYGHTIPLQDEDGNNLMLASHADTLNQNLGFSGVKGSFPSPDDLLNFAPTLADNVENNHMALLGQSILPLAYVVVRAGASQNENNIPILTSNDLIDIRPFFRTTELAYNERAGIAAAHPQISLANPVATQAYVDLPIKDINDRLTEVAATIPPFPVEYPKIIKTGYILGGLFYGVEGALMDVERRILGGNIIGAGLAGSAHGAQLVNIVRQKYNYPNEINLDPGWDVANWIPLSHVHQTVLNPNQGTINYTPRTHMDWINIINFDVFSNWGGTPITKASWFDNLFKIWLDDYIVPGSQNGQSLHSMVQAHQGHFENTYEAPFGSTVNHADYPWVHGGHGNYAGEGNYHNDFTFCFVKKRLVIDPFQAPWASDFHLRASYHNCTCKNGPSDIIVTKEKRNNLIEFTIFCVWAIKLKELHGGPNGPLYTYPGGLTEPAGNVALANRIGGRPFSDNRATFPLGHLGVNRNTVNPLSERWAKNYNGFLVMTREISEDIRTAGHKPAGSTTIPGGGAGVFVGDTSLGPDPFGNTNYGIALYPSVKFEIIGIQPGYNCPTIFHNNNTISLITGY